MRIILPIVTLVALVGTCAIGTYFQPVGSSHAASPTSPTITTFQGTAGTTALAGTTQLTLTPGIVHAGSTLASAPHVTFLPRHRGSSAVVSGTSSVTAADAGVDNTPGQLLQNFTGLNSVDQLHTNGLVIEPPDQGLCVGTLGGQKVVGEIINQVFALYTPAGEIVAGPENLNVLFQEPTTKALSDPRCVFDSSTQTFFFTAAVLSVEPGATENHDAILVLHQNLNASLFRVDTELANNTLGQCPCLGDQPRLGIDQNNLYLVVDQISAATGNVTGADLIALSKSQLIADAASVNTAEFLNLSLPGISIVALQPAITFDKSNQEFFLNSFTYSDPAAANPIPLSHTLGLWDLSNTAVVTAGGVPELSETTIASEIYGFPVQTASTGGKFLAQFSNDDRMQQVQFINGHLLGALNSAVAVGNDPSTRDGAAWFELTPLTKGNQIAGAKFIRQGYLASLGQYLLYPSIQETTDGTIGISFSITSPQLNPSTGYAVLTPGGANFGKLHMTSLGALPDQGFSCDLPAPSTCRWGDYSWTALDPSGSALWMAAENATDQIATEVDPDGTTFRTNWGTQVWEVQRS